MKFKMSTIYKKISLQKIIDIFVYVLIITYSHPSVLFLCCENCIIRTHTNKILFAHLQVPGFYPFFYLFYLKKKITESIILFIELNPKS